MILRILNSILGHEHLADKMVQSYDLQYEGVCTKLPIIKRLSITIITSPLSKFNGYKM